MSGPKLSANATVAEEYAKYNPFEWQRFMSLSKEAAQELIDLGYETWGDVLAHKKLQLMTSLNKKLGEEKTRELDAGLLNWRMAKCMRDRNRQKKLKDGKDNDTPTSEPVVTRPFDPIRDV
ncbi:hypothetical protein DM02DRAFT_632687 [Periconia macrospinosa]|uniref:Uncharacterized protein n=1 Tax=Periconia macrospinosa TaxID=97972 RepID=A0A2V1DBU8_9PLEO|nr:hypothetical protein DM02DRAFT_632687 [Periconia macrospinosa]